MAVVTTLRADIGAGHFPRMPRQRSRRSRRHSSSWMTPTFQPTTIGRLRPRAGRSAEGTAPNLPHFQREEFLPSAWAIIVAIVVFILTLLMFTNFDGFAESLATVGFLSFFFLSLLRLLSSIGTPFKVGAEYDGGRRQPVSA